MTDTTMLAKVVELFSTLTLAQAQQLEQWYSDDAWFKDPFNEVQGIESIKRIFIHMFTQVDAPRFVITDTLQQDQAAFLVWVFHFRIKGALRHTMQPEQMIRGATHVRFNTAGKICYHRDYWDAAEELYEKLPGLRYLMRALKKIANR